MDIYKPKPYVYRLDNPTTGEFYIGYREANKVPAHEDMGQYYWTSAPEIEARFTEFNWTIIAEFDDGLTAYDYENELIEANWGNPLLLNGHYHTKDKKRFKCDKEVGKKISATKKAQNKEAWNKGRQWTPEQRANISAGNKRAYEQGKGKKPPRTVEHAKALSKALTGRKINKPAWNRVISTIYTPSGTFTSLEAAAKTLNVSINTLRNLLNGTTKSLTTNTVKKMNLSTELVGLSPKEAGFYFD